LLGREPTHSELALGHQQGAGTAARMILNTGNASTRNLLANNVPAGASPQDAARHIMNYYGFDKKPPVPYVPGVSLASNPMLPGTLPEPVAPVAAPVAPAPVAAPVEPGLMSKLGFMTPESEAAMKTKALGPDGKGGSGSPLATGLSGLDDISKGLNPQVSPQAAAEAARISPMSGGAEVGGGGIGPQAQALLSQLMNARRQRYGLTLPGGMP